MFLLLALASLQARADIVLRDDTQTEVRLPAPAQRIVSLAPNITELVYAAGAGAKLVGTVDFNDYPAAAKRLPRVGSYARIDVEAIVALKPDLVLAWGSGNPPASLAQLRQLGIPVYVSEPRQLDDVARNLERYAALAGTSTAGDAAARDFRQRLAALQKQYAARRPVRVFYEVWDEPLMTVNGAQIISKVISLCGGVNVFADLPALAPTVNVEAVLAANPEAIVAGGMGEKNAAWLNPWRQWPQLAATRQGNLFFIDPNLLQRHTPRLLDGAAQLCEKLDQVRTKPQSAH
ncbi:MAG TPA: cobalamin-binding protein [Rhodocyclaceae bacterium]|nr:cobalamin-binding protein [Rhodocyclaceae bacterium]